MGVCVRVHFRQLTFPSIAPTWLLMMWFLLVSCAACCRHVVVVVVDICFLVRAASCAIQSVSLVMLLCFHAYGLCVLQSAYCWLQTATWCWQFLWLAFVNVAQRLGDCGPSQILLSISQTVLLSSAKWWSPCALILWHIHCLHSFFHECYVICDFSHNISRQWGISWLCGYCCAAQCVCVCVCGVN